MGSYRIFAAQLLRAAIAGVVVGGLVALLRWLFGPVNLDPFACSLMAGSGYLVGSIGTYE